jgi:hypothetical protein
METTMQTPPPTQPVDVAALARCAALNLSAERLAAVEAILSAWIPAANELSRKMSEPAHQSLLPVTTFTHAHEQPEEGA